MSDEDYCVYARSVLGRLDSIPNPTGGFTADIAREASNSTAAQPDMGLLMLGALVLIFCAMALLKRRELRKESKL